MTVGFFTVSHKGSISHGPLPLLFLFVLPTLVDERADGNAHNSAEDGTQDRLVGAHTDEDPQHQAGNGQGPGPDRLFGHVGIVLDLPEVGVVRTFLSRVLAFFPARHYRRSLRRRLMSSF